MPTRASDFTKKQMADVLRQKMTSKPLNKITIQEIVGECGLNRQTFYYHFQDIYDLLHWMLESDAEAIKQNQLSTDTWQSNLLRVLHYLEENRQMCLCALRSVQQDYLLRFLCVDVEPVVQTLVDSLGKGLEVSETYKKFLTRFYTLSITSLLIDWVSGSHHDLEFSAEELVEMISITIDGNLRLAMERYQQTHGTSE